MPEQHYRHQGCANHQEAAIALARAIEQGDCEAIKRLHVIDVDMVSPSDGHTTALAVAVRQNDSELAMCLLKAGADMSILRHAFEAEEQLVWERQQKEDVEKYVQDKDHELATAMKTIEE